MGKKLNQQRKELLSNISPGAITAHSVTEAWKEPV